MKLKPKKMILRFRKENRFMPLWLHIAPPGGTCRLCKKAVESWEVSSCIRAYSPCLCWRCAYEKSGPRFQKNHNKDDIEYGYRGHSEAFAIHSGRLIAGHVLRKLEREINGYSVRRTSHGDRAHQVHQ
jgi:hypothetical protein